MRAFQTLSNVNHPIPKHVTSTERAAIEAMEETGQDIAVESVSVRAESESCLM